jgi:hypothetical protein
MMAWSIILKILIFGSVDRQRDVLLKRTIKGGEEDGRTRASQALKCDERHKKRIFYIRL